MRLLATLDNYAALPLRIALAAIFLFTGINKAIGFAGAVEMFTGFGYPIPTFFVALVMIAEIVGGTLLLLGLFTRYASTWLAIVMIVAILSVNLRGDIAANMMVLLSNVVILGACLALSFGGAGRWSLDRVLLIE